MVLWVRKMQANSFLKELKKRGLTFIQPTCLPETLVSLNLLPWAILP